jgi:hypothetical protein
LINSIKPTARAPSGDLKDITEPYKPPASHPRLLRESKSSSYLPSIDNKDFYMKKMVRYHNVNKEMARSNSRFRDNRTTVSTVSVTPSNAPKPLTEILPYSPYANSVNKTVNNL